MGHSRLRQSREDRSLTFRSTCFQAWFWSTAAAETSSIPHRGQAIMLAKPAKELSPYFAHSTTGFAWEMDPEQGNMRLPRSRAGF
jgi:hypothetical protein